MTADIIIDFDGTLANESFGDIVRKDGIPASDHTRIKDIVSKFTPKKGVDILKELRIEPIIITGRQEALRDVSTVWLHSNGIPFQEMVMMPNNSYGDTFDWNTYVEYKIAAHRQYDVRFSLDDNKSLVTILNKVGIPTYLVEDDFAETFKKAWVETE